MFLQDHSCELLPLLEKKPVDKNIYNAERYRVPTLYQHTKVGVELRNIVSIAEPGIFLSCRLELTPNIWSKAYPVSAPHRTIVSVALI